MQPLKCLVILSALLVLSNCSKPEPITTTTVVQTSIPIKPKPRPVTLNSVDFSVVTNYNIDSYLKKVSSNGEYVFVAMSVKSYENMALNIDELKRYIEQQNGVIEYYEGYATN